MRPLALALTLSLVGASACTPAASTRSAPSPATGAGASTMDRGESAAGTPQAERLLVRRASLELEVKDLDGFARRAEALAQRLGGIVARTNRSSAGWTGSRSAHLVLRVPAASLEGALDSLATLGRVRARTTSSEDVTEQVVDLDARVANLRASRDRLRQLLAQASAVTDVIAVERELARTQGELDSLEGRLAYLRGTVALAEIDVEAHPRIRPGPLGWLLLGATKLVGWLFVLP